MRLGPLRIVLEDTPYVGEVAVELYPASPEAVYKVHNAPEENPANNEYERSEWLWVTLPTGDVMLACFPQSDLFSDVEGYISDDYVAARQLGFRGT